MLVSVFFFALVNTLVKFIGPDVTSWTKAFYRSLFGLIALVSWLLFKKKPITLNNLPLLLFRGIIGGIALGLTFWTLELKGLSISIFYLNTYPIFAPLFSALVFKEKFERWLIIPLVIASVGIYILTDPLKNTLSLGDVTGILSGLCAGIAIASVRELSKTNKSEVIYLSFAIVAIPVSFIAISLLPDQTFRISLSRNIPYSVIWISLIGIGISATIAQLLMTEAYQSLSTQKGSLIGLVQVPVIAGIAFILFKEPFTWSILIGGTLIGCSTLITILSKRKLMLL